jgi:hypothetical protein
MTRAEILAEMNSGSLRNEVRKVIYSATAKIEQALGQSTPPSVWKIREIEFEAADRVIELVKSLPNVPEP